MMVTIALVSIGCNNSHRGGDLRDADSNASAVKTMRDGRTWMTVNLNVAVPRSYCYRDTASECRRSGRLYTWDAAAAACRLLGAGWRLPTEDEWRQMARAYGGVRGDAVDEGRAAYRALVKGGASGFNAVFGGDREPDGSFARGDAHGFYWTATEVDTAHAWFYNFGRDGGLLNRHSEGDKAMAASVRCVRGS